MFIPHTWARPKDLKCHIAVAMTGLSAMGVSLLPTSVEAGTVVKGESCVLCTTVL